MLTTAWRGARNPQTPVMPRTPIPSLDPVENSTATPASDTAIRRAVVLYAVGAALWIFASDFLLGIVVRDPGLLTQLSAVKGWVFVGVTSVLLYALLRRVARRHPPARVESTADSPMPKSGLLGMLAPGSVIAAMIVALVAGAIAYSYRQHADREAVRIEAVADLTAKRIANWHHEFEVNAGFLRGSVYFANLYRHWLDHSDIASRDLLLERLTEFRKAANFQSAFVLDGNGSVWAGEDGLPTDTPRELHVAFQRAMTSNAVESTNIYNQAASPTPMRLDFVVPLAEKGRMPFAVLVLRVDAAQDLITMLREWPAPSRSASMVLLRQDGDVLSVLRNSRDDAVADPRRISLRDPEVFPARVLRGEIPLGHAAEAIDYMRIPILAAAQPVGDTGWLLVAKMDQSEIRDLTRRDALWIALTGLLALFCTCFASGRCCARRCIGMPSNASGSMRCAFSTRSPMGRRTRSLRRILKVVTCSSIAKPAD